MRRPVRRSRCAASPSSANGGSSTAPSPTAWRKPATGSSPSPVYRRASGVAPAPRMRSNDCTRSSSEGSRRRPCCRPPTPLPCCSGHCSPLARSTCARLMAGRRSPQSSSISQLTSQPETIPSCYRRSRHADFPPLSGRHRRPKPTRLKVLTGNPGKRPLNETEPRPEPAIPDCPTELGEVARREWNRLAGELASLKLLTNLDRAALAAYCGAYALWAEATEAIQKYGSMIKSPSGYPVQSPYLAIANRQAEIMMRIASEFGFTPASRSRISAPTPVGPDLFSGFGNGPEE